MKIETYKDLYYALKCRDILKESRNPQFTKLREKITEKIERQIKEY